MKEKNVLVQVQRYDLEKKDLVDKVIHISECISKDRAWARCPECKEKVRLMLSGDRHYEHETRASKVCKFKTAV